MANCFVLTFKTTIHNSPTLGAILITVIIAGCSPSVGTKASFPAQTLILEEVLADIQGVQISVPQADQIMALSPAMKELADRTTAGRTDERGQLVALVQALLDPTELGLKYDASATLTIEESFQQRRANCLSFTMLTVALARYLGLDARINDVKVPRIWEMQDEDTIVSYRHVNAVAQYRSGDREVVDFDLDEYDASFEQKYISDNDAITQFYNNKAMEHLVAGRQVEALRFLYEGLTLKRDESYLWNNLGALYSRAGQPLKAEKALKVAMEADPSDPVPISNAARLYRRLGNLERAQELERTVRAFRERNPYYRYRLGLEAFYAQDFKTAEEHAAAAIRLYRGERRFYALLGLALAKLGHEGGARRAFGRAMKLTIDPEEIERYKNKMDRLRHIDS